MANLRIGLFGGTFNPVHKGHQSIAQSFLDSGKIDELWILLTPSPPHKTGSNTVPFELRLRMLEAAFSDFKHVYIKTVENELPRPNFSLQTILHLKHKHPELKFVYCMGGDSLVHFHKWKQYRRILQECELLVATRPGFDYRNVEKEILERTYFVKHTPVAISSSAVREKKARGEPVAELLPKNVADIIEKEQLYS